MMRRLRRTEEDVYDGDDIIIQQDLTNGFFAANSDFEKNANIIIPNA